jgi:hypothetical protein
MTAAVLRSKVTPNHMKSKVVRRIEHPADIKLDRLRLTLQSLSAGQIGIASKIRARAVGCSPPSPDRPDEPLDTP